MMIAYAFSALAIRAGREDAARDEINAANRSPRLRARAPRVQARS